MTNSQRKTHETLAVITMRSLIVKAESPNQPVFSLPFANFTSLITLGFVEFGLTLSLVIAFIFRLFCL